jgi:mannose/cellobiose epimerase-like protein (N-acyl-D-glucosamine 2-epimerase family)/choline kinase
MDELAQAPPTLRQAVVLCGGLGTRLGALTASTPKPLLPVAGRPFLGILLEELQRQGISHVVLLAAFEADQVRAFVRDLPSSLSSAITVDVVVEPKLAGTAGAIRHATAHLDPVFFLLNGDSWFDIPLARLATRLKPDMLGVLALRDLPSVGRYGVVEVSGDRVARFQEKTGGSGPGLVNAGVYLLRRDILDTLPPEGSLERDVLPTLAREGRLGAHIGARYFIDIGIPDDYARAQIEIPGRRDARAVLVTAYERARAWLVDEAYPLWATTGIDVATGAFVERLAPDGTPLLDPQRARLVGRQIYAFSLAPGFGWAGPATEIVHRGTALLEARFLTPDQSVRSVVDHDGRIVRPDFDLYDHAFVLFGLAAARAAGFAGPDAAVRARAILGRIQAGWKHPLAGFEEGAPRVLPLLANPHMHMLEASLAWAEVDTDWVWRALADEIARLCLDRFLDPDTGALRERFDGDWNAIAEPAGIEPGHQFEWAWLLARWGTLSGDERALPAARRLVKIGAGPGTDSQRDLAVNELSATLTIVDARARLWPQTERIKAHLALAAQDGDDAIAALRTAARAVDSLARYTAHPTRGAWYEHIGPNGAPMPEPSRASSLYHIVCALEETRRYLAGS